MRAIALLVATVMLANAVTAAEVDIHCRMLEMRNGGRTKEILE